MIEEQKGAYEAENLLEELGFESLPIEPMDVANSIHCDEFKLVMEYKEFHTDKILGKAEGNSKGALIYINNNIPDPGRSKFTAAHEIGHVCMHIVPQLKLSFECGNIELTNPYDDPIEKEANGFASALLMPKNLIQQYSNGEVNWKEIKSLSRHCGASLEATYRRLSFLDKSPSALVIHQNCNFKRFVASSNFEHYINKSPLSAEQRTIAADVANEPYPEDFDTVDASDWVSTRTGTDSLARIYSSTISLKDGISYTLLSYDDDCLADTENF